MNTMPLETPFGASISASSACALKSLPNPNNSISNVLLMLALFVVKRMLKMFDYLYYRTYDIYQKKWKESMPWLYAWCVVALMQVLNLMLIGLAATTFLNVELPNDKAAIIALCTVVFGLTYIRYRKLGYEKKVGGKMNRPKRESTKAG